ncbi:hypothetical protein SAMN02949497_2001 [Methylomagnum ishizawai]|uniref:Uncharacterized protein n=1 Tax=Methylomagnum ishizawai TaxID=1760988 RepID=A0A1Y6D3Y9_9GAMM|nr:hypothetical protein [Methylomagnum ishizawai]SMF94675.1 hypothetical protein SAMN02949497_2001 [Methylomagnum ishizawai]
MEQEKDNFWLYIGGVILLAVVVVFAMRGARDDLEAGVKNQQAQAESKAEVEKQIERQHSK